jgi:hypothetical protein
MYLQTTGRDDFVQASGSRNRISCVSVAWTHRLVWQRLASMAVCRCWTLHDGWNGMECCCMHVCRLEHLDAKEENMSSKSLRPLLQCDMS